MQADTNAIFVSKSYNYLTFFLQILVSALMTANLWHKAQAQINPVISTVLGNGAGVSYISVPQNTQTFPNSVGGGTGVFQGADVQYAVSTTVNVQWSTVVLVHTMKAYRRD